MYAVLGATGRIGGAAARELRRRGFPVRAIVRDASKAELLAQNGCEVAVADVHDADALKLALEGASDVLVICPMNPRAENAPADHERMIEAIGAALEAVKPRSIAAISDYGAHCETGTGIALTFHRLEQRLRSIPVPCTIIRSAEHMQNWSRFIKTAANTGVLPTFYRPSTKLLPLVSAPDVGLIAADVMAEADSTRRRARVVHVEGPRRYSVEEVVKTMASTVGRPVEAREIPREEWISALVGGGLSEDYAQLVAEMYEAHNAGRIEIEAAGAGVVVPSAVQRGNTSLAEAFASLREALLG